MSKTAQLRPVLATLASNTKHVRLIKKILPKLNTFFQLHRTIVTETMIGQAIQDETEHEGQGSVYVQHSPGKDMMTISLEYSQFNKTKTFNLYRKAQEPVSTSFSRLKFNICKMLQPKKSKKETREDPAEQDNEVIVSIVVNGEALDPDATKNLEAWVEGAILNLGGKKYVIKRNEPQVRIMKLPSIIMRGFDTMPNLDVANCDVRDCKFTWYREIPAKDKRKLLEKDDSLAKKLEFRQNTHWLPVATGITYSPTDEDVARFINLACYPSNGTKVGPVYYCFSTSPVELGPPTCPFERRHSQTLEWVSESDRMRFVSYNILADLYADQEYSRSVLFAHCPPHILHIDYRRQLLFKEIHGYKADIICLQEVDKRHYIKSYEPYFKMISGHQGTFDTKGGRVAEGVATFFRQDRFELIETHRTILSQLIDPRAPIDIKNQEAEEEKPLVKKDLDKDCTDLSSQPDAHPILDEPGSNTSQTLLTRFHNIRSAIQSNEALNKRFMNRHTILQTNLLKVKGLARQYIIVANTHLYFAPDADHVRLLQGSVCVKYLEFIKEYYKTLIKTKLNEDDPKISVIFCGDMNSTPDCGLFKLVHEGRVTDQLPDWRSNEKEAVKGLSIDTQLRFSSAYRDLAYTNYTPEFNGWLDHIYYELDGIECESTVPMPEHEDVIANEGLPSVVFPSDHLALIANLRLTK